MNGVKQESSCLQMFLGLGMRNFREQPARTETTCSEDSALFYSKLSNYCNGCIDQSCHRVSSSVNNDLNSDMTIAELEDNAFSIPQNSPASPDMPVLQSMELDLTETDENMPKIVPVQDELVIRSEDERLALPSLEFMDTRGVISIKCLESMDILKRRCEEKGLNFNVVDDGKFNFSHLYEVLE